MVMCIRAQYFEGFSCNLFAKSCQICALICKRSSIVLIKKLKIKVQLSLGEKLGISDMIEHLLYLEGRKDWFGLPSISAHATRGRKRLSSQ